MSAESVLAQIVFPNIARRETWALGGLQRVPLHCRHPRHWCHSVVTCRFSSRPRTTQRAKQ